MDNNREQAFRSWDKFLNPDIFKNNLVASSLFIATYEVLRKSVVERIEDFYTNSFTKIGSGVSQDYQNKVLSLNKSPFMASQLWLKEMGAIDNDDMTLIHQIHDHRNELAHDILDFLTQADVEVNIKLMAEIYRIVSKIERWWIREVELPINPDYDGVEVADDEITSGTMLCIQIMIQTAAGEDSTALWEVWQTCRTNTMNVLQTSGRSSP